MSNWNAFSEEFLSSAPVPFFELSDWSTVTKAEWTSVVIVVVVVVFGEDLLMYQRSPC